LYSYSANQDSEGKNWALRTANDVKMQFVPNANKKNC